MEKFSEKKVPGLLGVSHVFAEIDAEGALCPGDFQILADAGGIRFQGESTRISNMEELDRFAKKVTEAWKAFDRLRPKITNAAGH